MSVPRTAWSQILVASAALAGAAQIAGVPTPVRLAVLLWFLLVCPGMAIVRLLDLDDPTAEFALAVALSVALAVAVGGAALYSGLWAPGAALAILIAVTVGAAAVPLVRAPGPRGRRS